MAQMQGGRRRAHGLRHRARDIRPALATPVPTSSASLFDRSAGGARCDRADGARVRYPAVAQPNAGLPRDVGDRKIYMASPEYVAEYARRDGQAGARFVVGCCGTTPPHIRAIRSFVKAAQVATPAARAAAGSDAPDAATGAAMVALAERSRLGAKLASGTFIRTVEIVPPRGIDPAPMLTQARALKAAGIDAVNIPDGPRAQSRMGALISALLVERETGLETVVHYACRDRNLLGMLSDLLGAAAANLRNLLIVTGDPPKMGPYPDATASSTSDAIGLTNLVAADRGSTRGNSIGAPTRFVHGVGVIRRHRTSNANSPFRVKADAGACFAMTQPVFDVAQSRRSSGASSRGCSGGRRHLAPGVAADAEFLANEVRGFGAACGAVADASGGRALQDAALAEGVTIAREMIAAVSGAWPGCRSRAWEGRVALEVLG